MWEGEREREIRSKRKIIFGKFFKKTFKTSSKSNKIDNSHTTWKVNFLFMNLVSFQPSVRMDIEFKAKCNYCDYVSYNIFSAAQHFFMEHVLNQPRMPYKCPNCYHYSPKYIELTEFPPKSHLSKD